MKHWGLLLLVMALLAACTQSEQPPTVTGFAEQQAFWNASLKLEFWQPIVNPSDLVLYVDGQPALAALQDVNSSSLTFLLEPRRFPLASEVIVEVYQDAHRIPLKYQRQAFAGVRYRVQGRAESGRINVLMECQVQAFSALERHFAASQEFDLVDYFGDRRSVAHPHLGASQHATPWCLAVIGFKQLSHTTAIRAIDLILDYYGIRPEAIAPDFHLYGNDPSRLAFDSPCSDNELIALETVASSPVNSSALREVLNVNSEALDGKGTTIAILDSGVASTSELHLGDSFSRLSRRFIGADYPTANPLALDVTDDYDCDGSSYQDGHGSLVTALIQQVAPETSIIALKVCDAEGRCVSSSLVKGLLYLRNRYEGFPRVDVINMSFGGLIEHNEVLEVLLEDFIVNYPEALLVASAGNYQDERSHYPAQYQNRYPNVVAVSAAKYVADEAQPWHLAAFNTRAVMDSSPLNTPLAAPGVALQVAGRPALLSGTSFAASLVSAIALLERQRYPEVSSFYLHVRLHQLGKRYEGFTLLQLPPQALPPSTTRGLLQDSWNR